MDRVQVAHVKQNRSRENNTDRACIVHEKYRARVTSTWNTSIERRTMARPFETFLSWKKDPRPKNHVKNVLDVHTSLNVFSKDIPGMRRSLLKALNVISEEHTRATGDSTHAPLSQ